MSRLAPLSLGKLIEHWTLRVDEIDLVAVKHGDSKLAFALLLRFYGRFGRFPRNRGELHPDAVEFMARAVKADPAELLVCSLAAQEAISLAVSFGDDAIPGWEGCPDAPAILLGPTRCAEPPAARALADSGRG